MAPVRLAIARCARAGSRPASQAITASTANSGRVWSQARMARASPWDIRNCAASAPQATRNAENRMLGKVHRAESAETDFAAVSSFMARTWAEDSGRRGRRKGTYGARSDEIFVPPQLPRVAHAAQHGADPLRDPGERDAHADRGGPAPRGPEAHPPTRHRVPEVHHPGLRDERGRRDQRGAVQREARVDDPGPGHRDL